MNSGANMVQYGVWPNCCNECSFCLRKNRNNYSKTEQIYWLRKIRKNIKSIDWKTNFRYGVSLLGGELYYILDKDVQNEFLQLIDDIIDYVLIPCDDIQCKYSTVTNGLYDPTFLYEVIDKIVQRTSIAHVDLNFSYDLKYRYKNLDDEKLVLKNINDFHYRYNYEVGVQMILTQYLIDYWKKGQFDVNQFIEQKIPGNHLCFLYPHPINSGKKIQDFNFCRQDFIVFIQYLYQANFQVFNSFLQSTKNSGTFKYTGYKDRFDNSQKNATLKKILSFFKLSSIDFSETQKPQLSDGKEMLSQCGHSVLYKCYADSCKCMLCDLMDIYGEYF